MKVGILVVFIASPEHHASMNNILEVQDFV